MLTKSKFTEEELNSGQLEYGSDIHIRENGKLIDSVFKPEGKLNFKYKMIREADYSLFKSLDRVDTKKVKVYYVEGIRRSHKVIINGETNNKWDITSMDPDTEKRYLYLYLERVKK